MTTPVKMTYTRNEKGEYICPDCPFTAKPENPSTMHYHMKKHLGNHSYVCSITGCSKSFIQKSGLLSHQMQVHGEGCASFICPWCEHSCKTKANLLTHVGRKHGEDWIVGWTPLVNDAKRGTCTACAKTFNNTAAYYYHAVQCFPASDDIKLKLASISGPLVI